MNCWVLDSWATGAYRSNMWFYVTAPGAVRGFVHSSRVDPQTTVPNCSTHPGIAAARWAAAREGELNKTGLKIPTDGDWSGDCWVLAWNAHWVGSRRTGPTGVTAAGAMNWYEVRGRLNRNLDPAAIPIGAVVFWPGTAGNSAGHAAIYVGNGHVASTQGFGKPTQPSLPNIVVSFNHFGTPRGWVAPTNVGA